MPAGMLDVARLASVIFFFHLLSLVTEKDQRVEIDVYRGQQ
jgi:hypothetical protein